MSEAGAEYGGHARAGREPARKRMQVRSPRAAYTFVLNRELMERARREVEEGEVVQTIEAALIAALDYRQWLRDVMRGVRDVRE